MLRDRRNRRALRREGWRIVRLWESDILANPADAALRIVSMVEDARDHNSLTKSPRGRRGLKS